jgi:hypothetical protein
MSGGLKAAIGKISIFSHPCAVLRLQLDCH